MNALSFWGTVAHGPKLERIFAELSTAATYRLDALEQRAHQL